MLCLICLQIMIGEGILYCCLTRRRIGGGGGAEANINAAGCNFNSYIRRAVRFVGRLIFLLQIWNIDGDMLHQNNTEQFTYMVTMQEKCICLAFFLCSLWFIKPKGITEMTFTLQDEKFKYWKKTGSILCYKKECDYSQHSQIELTYGAQSGQLVGVLLIQSCMGFRAVWISVRGSLEAGGLRLDWKLPVGFSVSRGCDGSGRKQLPGTWFLGKITCLRMLNLS